MADVLVGVGGTGQHLVLAALRLKELGALPPDLEAVVIDAAEDDLSKTLKQPWPGASDRHPLALGALVQPYDSKKVADATFQKLFEQTGAGWPRDEQELFEGFFDADEAAKEINKGMFGTPIVGGTVIAAADDQEHMRELLSRLSKVERVFIAGSLIGGTGAGVMHKLAHLIRRSNPGKPIHAIVFGNWFRPPEKVEVDAAKQRRNLSHGLEYVFAHTSDKISNALYLAYPGVKTVDPNSVVKLPTPVSGRETDAYLMLLGAYGIVKLPDAHRTSAGAPQRFLSIAHDTSNEDWALDESWFGTESLRRLLNLALALRVFSDFLTYSYEKIARVRFPSLLERFAANPDTITAGLFASIGTHAPPDAAEGKKFVQAMGQRWGAHVERLEFCSSWVMRLYRAGEAGGFQPWAFVNKLQTMLADVKRGGDDAALMSQMRPWLQRPIEVPSTGKLDAPALADRVLDQIKAGLGGLEEMRKG